MIIKELTTRRVDFSFDKSDKIILLKGKAGKVFLRSLKVLFLPDDESDYIDVTGAETECNNIVACTCECDDNLFSLRLDNKTEYETTDDFCVRNKKETIRYECLTDTGLTKERKSTILHFLPEYLFREHYRAVSCYECAPQYSFTGKVIELWKSKEFLNPDRYPDVERRIDDFIATVPPFTIGDYTLSFYKDEIFDEWVYNVFEEVPPGEVQQLFDMEDFLVANRLTAKLAADYVTDEVPPLYLINGFDNTSDEHTALIVQKLRDMGRQVFICEGKPSVALVSLCDKVY